MEWLFTLILGIELSLPRSFNCTGYLTTQDTVAYVAQMRAMKLLPASIDFRVVDLGEVNAKTLIDEFGRACIVISTPLVKLLEYDEYLIAFVVFHEASHLLVGRICYEEERIKMPLSHFIEIVCDLLAVRWFFERNLKISALAWVFKNINVEETETHPCPKSRQRIINEFVEVCKRRYGKEKARG